MFGYGKMSGCAVAAVSSLAEVHRHGTPLSSAQIAANRNLSQPLVAKVLTQLSQHGIVNGTRGPGGGYRLTRDPAKISIFEIVELFEGHRDPSSCPFGPGWCGVGELCPLHNDLAALGEANAAKLKKTSFASFVKHPKPQA